MKKVLEAANESCCLKGRNNTNDVIRHRGNPEEAALSTKEKKKKCRPTIPQPGKRRFKKAEKINTSGMGENKREPMSGRLP